MAVTIFPFAILLIYSLVSAGSVAVARVGMGPLGNMSRYATVAIPAYLGLAGIVAHVSLSKKDFTSPIVLSALASSLVVAVVMGAGTGVFSSFVDKQESRQAKLSLAIRKLAQSDPLLTNVYPLPEFVSRMADELEAFGILTPLPSYAWLQTSSPVHRSDLTFRMSVRNFRKRKGIVGALTPGDIAEPDDILVLSDKTTGAVLTALLSPSGMNYPGIPVGSFEVRFNATALGTLSPDDCDLDLARPRTHEVWRLRRQEGL
jgi:hypothetical protein